MKHTPTPWNFDITADGFNVYSESVIKIIATVCYKEGLNNLPNKAEAEASAEFIVEAVNSHEELKRQNEELKEALRWAFAMCDKLTFPTESELSISKEIFKQALKNC